jgi:glycosyltransferase involved in cell wall biosynthesis/GT2 family glycosyltransferase
MEIDTLKVTILIISLGREKEVNNIVQDLLKQNYPNFKVYIVCQDFKKKIKLKNDNFHIEYITKRPFTKLLNQSIRRIESDIIIRIDDDVKIKSNNFIKNHIKNYKEKSIGAVAGQVLNLKQKSNNSYNTTGRFNWFFKIPMTEGYNSNKRQQVDLVQGANYSFRKSVYTKVGGFNEQIIGNNYFEETDFALKIRMNGYKIIFDPKCSLIHLKSPYGGAREKNISRWFYFFGYNYAQLLRENFGIKSIYLGYLYVILSTSLGSLRHKRIYIHKGIQGYLDGIKTNTNMKNKIIQEKIKVIFITGALPKVLCGVGMYTQKLTGEIAKDKSIDLQIIVVSKEADIENISTVKTQQIKKDWNIKTFNKIIKKIQEIDPNIIHIQFPSKTYELKFNSFTLFGMLNQNFKDKIIIFTLHELSQSHIVAKIRNIFYLKYFKYIITPNINDEHFIKKLKVFSNKEVFNIPLFPNNYKKVTPVKGTYFCFIGLIDSKKGIETLLLAVKALHEQNINIKIKFITKLDITKNKYHMKLYNTILKYGIKDEIEFTNPKDGDEVVKELSKSFAVILPFNLGVSSRNGTFLEAISYGKPVITTRGKYTSSDIFINNKNVLLVKPKEYKELAQKIKTLLKSKKLYNKVSIESKKLSQGFEISQVAQKHISLYRQLLKK